MLCPEVWDFRAPQHSFKVDKSDCLTKNLTGVIKKHYFNHSISIVLPDTTNLPEYIFQSFNEDNDYYRINNIPVSQFVDKEFIEAFVKKGEVSVLAIENRIDVDNSLAITPSGHLVLSLIKEDFQGLGIEGKPSFFDRKLKTRFDQIMPKKHQIPTLEELALRSVGQFVTEVGRYVIQPICKISLKDPVQGIVVLNSRLEWIRQQLISSVPWYLYDRMSVEALKAVLNLINETKNSFNQYFPITTYLSEMNVVVNLTEVVIHSNLKTIEFSVWPKIMRHVLYKNLPLMTGLEILDLGSGSAGWKTSGIEKMIIRGVSAMPNLTSFTLCFDCTDSIVTAVGQNCPKLQKLDVTASRSVTDRCLTILQKCWQLREIQLFRTSVSIAGYAELILEHLNLEDIGRCDEFGYVLEHVRVTGSYKKPFNLKVFESRDVTTEHLYLLVEMCPYLTKVSIVHDETINDLMILSKLNNLTELKLLCCDFFTDRVKELLENKGAKITSLHLEHVNEIDLNALVYISQFCPKLKNLVLYNCEFIEHAAVVFNGKLFIPPFKYLERIKCVADCANLHLEFLLSHCVNIKFIQLGSSTGIGDDTMARVLSKNSMNKLEELKILYSDDLSMKTVRLLMQNCDNLRRLSELESWQGISIAELDLFQNELKIKNIDLDISPTLSLA